MVFKIINTRKYYIIQFVAKLRIILIQRKIDLREKLTDRKIPERKLYHLILSDFLNVISRKSYPTLECTYHL